MASEIKKKEGVPQPQLSPNVESKEKVVAKEKPSQQPFSSNSVARKQMSFRQNFTNKETRGVSKTGLDSLDIQDSLNAVIYGTDVTKFSKTGKKNHSSFLYMVESDLNMLQWISAQKKFPDARVKISEIKNMYSQPKKADVPNLETPLTLCFMMEGGRELVFTFESKKKRDLFQRGITFLKEYGREMESSQANTKESFVVSMLIGANLDKKKKISDKDVKKLLRKMLIQIRQDELDERLKKYYKNAEKMITYQELIELAINLLEKQEIQPLFQKYCANPKMILYQDIITFFQVEQGETYDEKSIMLKLDKLSKGPSHKILNYITFSQLLFSQENTIFDVSKTSQAAILDKPLSNYFVSTSINSYLAYEFFSQLKDPARGYIILLQKGVRFFDLFCIDGESGEPQVMQGGSQSTAVNLSDIAKAVKQYGFERNFSPLFINLEHECSLQQQEKIAEIFSTTFGDMLYRVPEDFIAYQFLPSPNQLKRKILLCARGKLSNIISVYEKKIAKKVKDREDKERVEKERFEKAEEERRRKLREEERRKFEQQMKEAAAEDSDEDDDPNNKYVGIRLGGDSDDEEEDNNNMKNRKKSNNSQNQSNTNTKQTTVSQQRNGSSKFGNNTSKSKSPAPFKNSKTITPKKKPIPMPPQKNFNRSETTNLNQPKSSAGQGANSQNNALVVDGNRINEIELLITLEMNLDKEFINDDSYASVKTSQVNQFSFQSSKALITANREVKSMLNQQQNSQYSLAENPKEAMQRKMRTDQQFQFYEVKSPSLKSSQSNKQHRHSLRSASFKQIPHLEIPFKSDVPIQEYHGSQPNLNLSQAKDDVDSPVFSKHQNGTEKKRQSLLYMARKRASVENIQPVTSILNSVNHENSVKDGSKQQAGSKEGKSQDSDSSQQDEVLSQDLFADTKGNGHAQADETFMPIQLINSVPNNIGQIYPTGMDSLSQRLVGGSQDGPFGNGMQNSMVMTEKQINGQTKTKKVAKKKNTIPISNQMERSTTFFACKYPQQSELSIWSISKKKSPKITELLSQLMLEGKPDDNAAVSNLIQHTKKFLMRIAPSIYKGEAQNYNFTEMFCSGCQFAGMHYGCEDLFLLSYLQFFKQNGGSGYVLKPSWLQSDSPVSSSQYYEKEASRPRLWVKVEIISAQSLRVPNDEEKKISPVISVHLIGTEIDKMANETIFTSSELNPESGQLTQCFNPQFDSFIADFTIHVPELAFVVFQIFNGQQGTERFAQYAVPVSCIRKGFRVIPLLDQQFNPIPNSFLFAHISVEVLTNQQLPQANSKEMPTSANEITSKQPLPLPALPQKKQISAPSNFNTEKSAKKSTNHKLSSEKPKK